MYNRFERFTYAITQISYHWHKIAGDEMGVYGLKANCALYLLSMLRNDEGITAARLCELCGRDKADVSRAVTEMERKGLLTREGGAKGYRALLRLTPEGMKAAEHVRRRASLAVELAGKELSDDQRICFYDALELIAGNLAAISKDGLPD